ncbi:MAG: glutamyl-tRNA reductase [Methanobacteriaceae archaeon]
MIINIRVDHKTADIETMETVAKEVKVLFQEFMERFHVQEYIEIATCNREEYYIHSDLCPCDSGLLNSQNENIIIEWDDNAIKHLFKTSAGLESMIIGEDQILGQIRDAKNRSIKESHCGKVLDLLFTKAIHVGQSIRKKTKINRGSVSIGSAAVDLAESVLENLKCKKVLVIGAGKMGTLVAKALSQKNLSAIFVANRTYYKAVELAKELGGEAILFDDLNPALATADVVISATGSPHTILKKDRIELAIPIDRQKSVIMIDIANPRDIDESIGDLGIRLFNMDDLKGIASQNKKTREKEAKEAMEIVEEEFMLLKKSFKTLEVESLISDIRYSMEIIRQKENEKARIKVVNSINIISNNNNNNNNRTNKDNDGNISDIDNVIGYNDFNYDCTNEIKNIEEILENFSSSIVNKIFHNISLNIKNAAKNEDTELIRICEMLFSEKNES